MRGLLINQRTAERHRKILILRPDRQQIPVERTFRLTGLPGCVDGEGVVPVGNVDDLAVAGAVGADRAIAAAPLNRRQVERRENWMREGLDVHATVMPRRPV